MDRGTWRATVHRIAESDTTEVAYHSSGPAQAADSRPMSVQTPPMSPTCTLWEPPTCCEPPAQARA